MPNLRRAPIAVAAVVLASTALVGCSQFSDLAHGESTSHAETRSELRSPPSWLPSDARDITAVTGTRGDEDARPRTVVFTSTTGVTATDCTTVPRNSGPMMGIDGAPDAYAAKTVTKCGAWSMTAVDDRWVAWTPNTGDGKR